VTDELPAEGRRQQVRIVHLDAATFDALADTDLERADRLSPVPLSPYCADPEWAWLWRLRAQQVRDHPDSAGWVTGAVFDLDRRITVGHAGYHGPPDDTGTVEIGYAVDPAHRRRGYARAAVLALLERAGRDDTVRTVRATIAPTNTASRDLVLRLGFVEVGEQWDEEDGTEVVYEIAAS
jgi:RimJ/RimL family protein N-acetyltransferase